MTRHYFISNMECVNCKKIIKNTLSGIAGVSKVSIKLLKKEAVIDADYNIVSDEDIIAAVKNHNYIAVRRLPR